MDKIGIPEAREQLKAWAIEWDRPELAELADKMYRRTPKYRKARATRKSLTIEMAKRIRAYKRSKPEMSNRDIGRRFKVDGGRVSEAIHNLERK